MKAQLTEMLWLEAHPDIRLSELAELSGLPEAELRALTDYGVLQPVAGKSADLSFRAECIVMARKASRLQRDLELNTEGLALALRLLMQVQRLEIQLDELRAKLPGQTDPD